MLQLIGFFLACLAALHLLRLIPGIGGLFQVPFVGFLLASVLVSAIFSRVARELFERRRERRLEAQFRGVSTPHNEGKLGSLLLARGRARQALAHLERALEGDPQSAEWSWKLGQALEQLGRPQEALAVLAPLLGRDEEYAYGELLLLAARCERQRGAAQAALELLARHERVCGEDPAALLERGRCLQALGRKSEARIAFSAVSRARRTQVRWKRGESLRVEMLARLGQLGLLP